MINESDKNELNERISDSLMYIDRLREFLLDLETEIKAIKETWEEIRG